MQDWLQNSIDNNVLGDKSSSKIQKYRQESEYKEKGSKFLSAVIANLDDKEKKYVNRIMSEISQIDDDGESLDKLVRRYQREGWKNYADFEKYWNKDMNKHKFNVVLPIDITESVDNTGSSHLNEVAEVSKYDQHLNYDQIFIEMKTKLSQDISECISSRSEWMFIKGLEEAMKQLKDKTSELVVKRIHHVCKTKESDRKSLITWPLKANGILQMWDRYSVELDTRIKNRCSQFITGSNGIPEMLEQFLTDTYPAIIAMLLTYRCAFEQMNLFLKRGYIPKYTLEDIDKIIKMKDESIDAELNLVIVGYDNTKI